MSKRVLDSTFTARVYAIGSAGVFILDKAVKYGFNYNYARATALGSDERQEMSIREQNTRVLRDIEKITERALQEAWLTGYQQALKDMSNDLDVKANDNE